MAYLKRNLCYRIVPTTVACHALQTIRKVRVRECLAIEVDTSLRAERVVKVLERLKGWRGTPRVSRLDNGPELSPCICKRGMRATAWS